jgi:hypothetical protein
MIDHGHVLLVMLLALLLHVRLVLDNILHYLVFHGRSRVTTGVTADCPGVNAADMTTRMTTRMSA